MYIYIFFFKLSFFYTGIPYNYHCLFIQFTFFFNQNVSPVNIFIRGAPQESFLSVIGWWNMTQREQTRKWNHFLLKWLQYVSLLFTFFNSLMFSWYIYIYIYNFSRFFKDLFFAYIFQNYRNNIVYHNYFGHNNCDWAPLKIRLPGALWRALLSGLAPGEGLRLPPGRVTLYFYLVFPWGLLEISLVLPLTWGQFAFEDPTRGTKLQTT